MNRNRKIVVVSALGIVALGLTAGWLAGDGWPPEPYQVSSMAGAWTAVGGDTIFTVSPEDPQTGAGFGYATHITYDPSAGGTIPDATAMAPCIGKYVRTGPNTWQWHGITYWTKDAKPKPIILYIDVIDSTFTMSAPGKLEMTKTNTFYSAAADKDGDGLPDAGEKPLVPPWDDPVTIWKSL